MHSKRSCQRSAMAPSKRREREERKAHPIWRYPRSETPSFAGLALRARRQTDKHNRETHRIARLFGCKDLTYRSTFHASRSLIYPTTTTRVFVNRAHHTNPPLTTCAAHVMSCSSNTSSSCGGCVWVSHGTRKKPIVRASRRAPAYVPIRFERSNPRWAFRRIRARSPYRRRRR